MAFSRVNETLRVILKFGLYGEMTRKRGGKSRENYGALSQGTTLGLQKKIFDVLDSSSISIMSLVRQMLSV